MGYKLPQLLAQEKNSPALIFHTQTPEELQRSLVVTNYVTGFWTADTAMDRLESRNLLGDRRYVFENYALGQVCYQAQQEMAAVPTGFKRVLLTFARFGRRRGYLSVETFRLFEFLLGDSR